MSVVRAALSTVVVCLIATTAFATTAQRTFVSAGTGADTNPCTRISPCRNFAAAIAATSPGGEVIVLDSGGYGPVDIVQSVSINSPSGVYAGITVLSGTVVFRGLSINALGGNNGIYWHAGSDLHVENCALSNFAGSAVANDSAVSTNTSLFVTGTRMRQNSYGINTSGPEGLGLAKVSIDESRFEGAGGTTVGVNSSGDVNATITRSVADGLTLGFNAIAGSNMTIDSCIVSHNATGAQADAFGICNMSDSNRFPPQSS